jgi:ATP-dependent Lhr-like helicase
MKDALTEAMDLEGLQEVLEAMAAGRIQCIAVDTPVPSQFSHEILNANPYAYLDDAPLEERRARAVGMRRALPESVLSEIGRLDPAAIAEVRKQACPDVRDADELHDALLTLGALPESSILALPARQDSEAGTARGFSSAWNDSVPTWANYFAELTSARRAGRALVEGRAYWVATEKAATFAALFPSAHFESELPELDVVTPPREDAAWAYVQSWMAHLGPVRATALGDLLGIEAAEMEKILLRLEGQGAVLRGHFANSPGEQTEWCERRLLARIHRQTLETLRSRIEPLTAAQFMRWLLRWQHVAPGTQVLGERGTLEVLRQVQGFEAQANSWERQILARRIADYDPQFLDRLCLTGAVGWGRLSPHRATLEEHHSIRQRIIPTSVAPLAFFIREDAEWMVSRQASEPPEPRALTSVARDVLHYLRQRGASFFADVVRGTGKLKAEVETALWELVTAGMITADGFDNIRALIDPQRRSGQGRGHHTRPRHSVGRWSLLHGLAPEPAADRSGMLEATCWMLLRRYGVVFREMVERETIVPRWRELLITFRRLEDRGEIRGGRFVTGFLGEQFGLPVAVESLRAMRQAEPSRETVRIHAADPLNLVGILLPGERISANSGKVLTLRDGVLDQSDASSVLTSLAV